MGSARTPAASAQCYGCYGSGMLSPYAMSPYGYGMSGPYGMGMSPYGYGYGLSSPYAMSPYGYGLSSNSYTAGAYGTMGMTYQPSYSTTYGAAPTYVDSGRYCTDQTGGQIWVNTGAPTEGLNCGGSSASSPGMSPVTYSSPSAPSYPSSSPAAYPSHP